ncbi:MAG: GAF domain-containing serine/threonine-protein kinase [Gemmatales bacterium]
MNHIVHYPSQTPREERPSVWSSEIILPSETQPDSKIIQSLLPYLEPCEATDSFGAIGSMELLQILGVGGMGCVCLAFDTVLERTVAIKFLLPHLREDHVAFTRFLHEARSAAAVSHANVISIYTIGEIDGLPYLVMPFVAGGSLEGKLIEHVPLPVDVVIDYGKQLATGLTAAHEAGLIHRDIKPANVMVETETNRLIITDFGLARDIDAPMNLTVSGNPLGSPSYFSPEQAGGEPADHRSDLYSLGVLLYRMATGVDPFPADALWAMMLKHATVKPTPPMELRPDLPLWLNSLILKMLEKLPEDRPQSAHDVLVALGQGDDLESEAYELARLDTLRQFMILDTETEQCFDDLVNLASQICGTPIATLTLVDKERQWFKAQIGVSDRETHRNLSFCAHAIKQTGPFVVTDATQDSRFQHNELVTSDPNIRFYAGMPLFSSEGYGLGTLCVIDRTPRTLTQEQVDALAALSRIAMSLMNHRRVMKVIGGKK